MENRQGVWWAWATFAIALLMTAIVFLSLGAADDTVRGVYPAIAGTTALYLLVAFGVPAVVQPMPVRVDRRVAWAAGIASAVAVLVPISLWHLDRVGLGYQWIQSIKLGTSPFGFGDLKVTFAWLDCVDQGIDPYTGPLNGCSDGLANYGPSLLWLHVLPHSPLVADVLGIVAVLVSSLALVWLGRFSRGRGLLVVLVASVSSAWVTLLERGNFDVVIIWAAILLVVLVRRMQGLTPWVIAAVPVWILGSWKYYPFAMILAFLPVLRLRRGWLLIVSFLGLAVVYLALNWTVVLQSMASQGTNSGGIGRNTLGAFIGGEAAATSTPGWADALTAALVIAALLWGWFAVSGHGVAATERLLPSAMLAVSGAITVLASVFVSGFGWQYKAALLLLAVPLFSRMGGSRHPRVWRATTTLLILTGMSVIVVWNGMLGSIATLVAASFALGASSAILMRSLRPARTPAGVPAALASGSSGR